MGSARWPRYTSMSATLASSTTDIARPAPQFSVLLLQLPGNDVKNQRSEPGIIQWRHLIRSDTNATSACCESAHPWPSVRPNEIQTLQCSKWICIDTQSKRTIGCLLKCIAHADTVTSSLNLLPVQPSKKFHIFLKFHTSKSAMPV
jgi:hypothetical protein